MEKSRVIRSAFKVGGFTLLSRFLGLLRDTLTAAAFGTSAAMSDFVVAFRIPNLFRALFGEGALSSAFVPVFMDTRRKEGDALAWLLAKKVISLVATALLGIVVLGTVLATALMNWPALADRAPLILPLARIMFPYMLFICLAALSQAILNSYHRFSLPAFTPSLLNITWILFVLFICPLFGESMNERIYGLAWAVFTAGLIQLAIQLPSLKGLGYKPGFTFDWKDPRVMRVFTLMGPTALGQSVTQVNVMVNGLLARWAAPWAPASLFYAERLLYFPQGILATALGTVLLPVFSGHAADGDTSKLRDTLNHALRTLLFVMAPASIGLFVLAEPITQMLFGWGVFNAESVSHTAIALKFYAPGLFVFCLGKVFVPAFYAMQDTRTPFRVGLLSVALNLTMNVVFIMTWPVNYKHAGLALATVISEGVNGLTLARCLHKKIGSPGWRQILVTVGRAVAGSLVMAVVLVLFHPWLAGELGAAGLHAKVVQIISVLGAIAVGAATYFLFALAIRSPEIGNVKEALLRRGGKQSIEAEL
ncbi:MAG: murein biosynthesis integral membrane protein MurJ [bacterium]